MQMADRIRTAREEAKLSKAEFARRLGISDKTSRRWEQGVTQPNTRQLPLIAAATGKPVDFFFVAPEPSSRRPGRSLSKRDILEALREALDDSIARLGVAAEHEARA